MNNKILFVDNSTRSFTLFRMPIALEFKRLGYEVYVLSPETEDGSSEIFNQAGLNYIKYKLGRRISLLNDLKLTYTFYKLYKRLNPAYVYHYTIKPNIFGSLAARFAKLSSFSIVPGTGELFKQKNLITKIAIFLYRLAFKYVDGVWVLNSDDYENFINNKVISPQKISILPGEGVNTNHFKPTIEYKKNSPVTFLYLGRMLKEKGVEIIYKASKLLKEEKELNFQVCLLGLCDGLAKNTFSKEEIMQWHNEGAIKYLGSCTDARKHIENSDCILLPSFYGEGVPRSLMEACAMEKVIITTDNVGCREVVEDGINGLVCKIKDEKDLADKMQTIILMSEDSLKQMGKNGRNKMIQEFDEKVIITHYINNFQHKE